MILSRRRRHNTGGLLRSARGDRGYAMILFIIVLLVITVMSTTVTTTAYQAASSARDAADRLSARALAANAVDEFYAGLTTRPELITVNSDGTLESAHPAVRDATTPAAWARMDGSNPVSCDPAGADKAKDCYFVDLTGEKLGSSTRIRSVVVNVTTRVGCDPAGDYCTYAKFQQRIRRVQFFDYLFFNQYTALDPARYSDAFAANPTVAGQLQAACAGNATQRAKGLLAAGLPSQFACLEISYLGRTNTAPSASGAPAGTDIVRGPVYTADEYISICGNPLFTGSVAVHGSGATHGGSRDVWKSAEESNSTVLCNGIANNGKGFFGPTTVDAPLLEMPSLVRSLSEVLTGTVNNLTQDRVRIEPDTAGVPVRITFSGGASGTQIDITDGRFTEGCSPVTSSCNLKSQAAVIVTRANSSTPVVAEVSGTVSGQVMLFSADDIVVTNDLRYSGGRTGTDVTVLVAGNNLKIDQVTPSAPAGTVQPGRTIDGFLVALNGGPHVPNWASSTSSPRWSDGTAATSTKPLAPTLTVFGGIAGKYQGVYGGFNGTTGYVVHGYTKDFTFDARLALGKTTPPPLLIAPDSSAWLRVDITEVPVSSASIAAGAK
jgi:hypothetical protein